MQWPTASASTVLLVAASGLLSLQPRFAQAQGVATPTAVASEPAPDGREEQERALARALFEEGLRFADAGDYPQAVDRFRRTYALKPASGVAYNLATALIASGRLVEATELLRTVLQDEAAARPLRRSATDALAGAEARLANLTVTVDGHVDGATVRVSDRALPVEAWGVAVPADPGPNQIIASRAGRVVAQALVELDDHGTGEVTLTIPAPPPPEPSVVAVERAVIDEPAGPPSAVAADAAAVDGDDSSVTTAWWFWTGIGAVVIAGTAALVAVATSGPEAPIPGTASPGVITW